MILTTIVVDIMPSIESYRHLWPGGLFALAAALLLIPETSQAQRIQLSVLIVIGLVLLAIGAAQGAVVSWPTVLSQNTGLLTMVLSVGLLKLIITAGSLAEQKLPVGKRAYLHTLLSVGVFGSIINISAPILISDRLTLNRRMDYFTAATVTRTFCMCSAGSPFFAGTAIVLTAVAGVHLPTLIVNGMPLLLIAIVLLNWFGLKFQADKLEKFHGYPMQFDSLLVPIMFAVIVFLASLFFPGLGILVVIALSAIAITFGMLLYRQGFRGALFGMGSFVKNDLCKSVNELQLFLAAGVLASGLQAMVQIGSLSAPFATFNSTIACALLAMMTLIAALGLHPVIQIAAMTPIILNTNPNPELLGLTYLFAWALGTCASPLSGTNLVMQGRYGVVAWRNAVQNWPFVGVMYVFACVLLVIRGALTH